MAISVNELAVRLTVIGHQNTERIIYLERFSRLRGMIHTGDYWLECVWPSGPFASRLEALQS